MKIILQNNRFVKDAKVSLLGDLGRGFGVFETLRSYENKKIFKLREHLNRLFTSAKKINLKIRYSKIEITKMTEKVVKKSKHKLQRIKIIATNSDLIIFSTPLRINKKIYNGVECITIEQIRALPEVKSISYLPSFLSHEKAVNKGFFEAILIDNKGEVFEGAYSNLFWFEGKTLYTRKDKILAGITRETILKTSPFKTNFKNIKLKSLLKKKEIFLSSSIMGIVPVTKINKTKIGNGEPGEKTKKLHELLIDKTNQRVH